MATSQHEAPRSGSVAQACERIAAEVETVICGKRPVIDLVLAALLAEGHVLLEDVPGVGKTSLAKALAATIEGDFGRIQFTPDLLPTDVSGVTIYRRGRDEFEFRPGPVFANIVLADEINRASPKTQAALLEAMAEEQVTVDGTTHPLAAPFLVLATQNPIEHEGTFPLPDSQLDRFLVRIDMGYPDADAELAMLDAHGSADPLEEVRPVATTEDVLAMRRSAATVHVAPALKEYLVQVADRTRRHPHLELGMSPRATLSFMRIARVWAAMRGRDYATPDDIKALAVPVLAHRLLVTPEADLQGVTAADVVRDVLDSVPVPRPRTA
ncbi:MAG TPA: MoxR family ATPase [Acidimicrobiales bacterium]|nr:MoxR family ATPase [Acidimicrobiales bacterium]